MSQYKMIQLQKELHLNNNNNHNNNNKIDHKINKYSNFLLF